MPISLGAPTTNPKWRAWILNLLWLAQLLVSVCLFFMSLLMVVFLVGSESHKFVPWYYTAQLILFLIANTLLLATVCYECTYSCGSLVYLSASRFYRLQLVKSLYFLGLVIFVSVRDSGNVRLGQPMTVGEEIWRGVVIVGPFWLALIYAVLARRKNERLFSDESGVMLRMLW